MKKTEVLVHTSVATMAGVALLCLGALAAAAGFITMATSTTPILTIKALPSPASHTSIAGTFEPMIYVSLAAQNKAITVDSLKFSIIGDTDASFATIENNLAVASHVASCTLNNGQGGAVGQAATADAQGNVAFTNLNFAIPANASRPLRVWCTLTTIPVDGGNPDIYAVTLKNDASVGAHATQGSGVLTGSRVNVGGPNDPGVNVNGGIAVTVSDAAVAGGTGDTISFALASTPASTTIVDGSDNVAVVGFNVSNTGPTEVTVGKIVLSAYGDLDGVGTFDLGGDAASQPDINDYIESCSLYAGTTLIGGPRPPEANGNTIIFGDPSWSWTLGTNANTQLTVKCNFANTSVAGNAYFSFDIADEDTDIVVEDASGNALAASEIIGDTPNGGTSPSRIITLVDSGSLSVTVGPNTPTADFILTSTNNAEVAEYRFTATNEPFNVQTLEFTEEQAEDDTGSADSSAYANNISLVTVSYPKADGTTGTATSAMSGNAARFSGLSMYVPVGSAQDIKVYVNTPPTDRNSGGSATSNEKLRIAFSDGNNSGSESFKAVGASSGFTIDEAATGINDIGDDSQYSSTDGVPTFVIRETKPVISPNASSPSGSAVPGRAVVFTFDVTASANEDLVIKNMIFKLNLTDNANSGWSTCDTNSSGKINAADFDLYNFTKWGTTQTVDATDGEWSLLGLNGATLACPTATTVGFARLTMATPEVVPSGTTPTTYKLYFDSTGASSSYDDSLRVDLPTDPIVSTYLAATTISDTSLTSVDPIISVASGTALNVGDVVCFSGTDTTCSGTEERALVSAIVGNSVTVIRGYLGTNKLLPVNGQNIVRLPSTMLWQDDGSASTVMTSEEYWGSYLVRGLTRNGGTLVF